MRCFPATKRIVQMSHPIGLAKIELLMDPWPVHLVTCHQNGLRPDYGVDEAARRALLATFLSSMSQKPSSIRRSRLHVLAAKVLVKDPHSFVPQFPTKTLQRQRNLLP